MSLPKATLAAGCFWGVQYYFDQVPGVVSSIVGYTGGHTDNPTYEEVCAHTTGHAEAVEIKFDPDLVTYGALLKHFFRLHDPTQLNRQGPDVGDSYRSAIFYHSASQQASAETAMERAAEDLKKSVVTQIVPVGSFYVAEEYHQKFAQRTGRGQCRIDYKLV